MNTLLRFLSRHWVVVLLSCMLFGAGLLRLNDLCLYTPDSSRYLIWGNAIAHGDGFVDATQPDPDRVVVHAPFYSVLIAPVELVVPLSLTAVKVYTLLWGVLALMLLYALLARMFGSVEAKIGAVLFACNPLLLLYSTEALSEAPFVALVLGIMLLCERLLPRCERPGQMILLTCCVAVAPLLREVGLAVVLAVTIYLFSHRQFKWGATILLAAVVLSGLWLARNQFLIGAVPGGQSGNLSLLVQHFATPPDGSLAVELLLRMWLNVKRYALQAGGMILYPLFSTHQVNLIVEPSWYYRLFQDLFTVLQYLVTLVVAPLVLLGLYRDMKSSSSWGLRFMIAAGYLIAILVYPINDIRFLMPLIPFVILYAIKGTGIFREFVSDAFLFASKRMSVALAALVMIPNIAGMHEIVSTNQSYRDDPVGMAERLRSTGAYPPIFTQPWGLLGAWIRENVAEGEVIGTPSKELATVVGNRSVLELDPGVPLPMFESLLRDNRAGYLLAPVRWSDMKVYEFMMSESRRLSFTEVYSVANLHLYRVASRFTLPDSMRGASPAPIDTTTVTGLLRRGRTALIRGETGAALKDLAVAYASAPLQPDVAYQAIVGFSFAGDSARALDIYHNLMTLPQSGSYLFLSRVQLEIMARVKKAAAARMPEERVVRMFDAASEYWKLGYGNQAYRIMNEVVALDTNYLNGLLWALHFSLQNGDTARARADLGYLRHIDVANPVVQAFGTVLDLADSLRLTSKPKRRSQIHLSIAKVYRQIELKEEALDEALRAIGEEPGNTKAMMFVAECFEQKSRSLAALSMYSEVARRDPANPVARARADSLRSVRSAL